MAGGGYLRMARAYANRRLSSASGFSKEQAARAETLRQAADFKPRNFEFRGAVSRLRELDPGVTKVLVEGPAGTGKTLGILAYLYELMDKYPGCRILVMRKSRDALNETVLVTWENQVVPEGHPMLNGPARRSRQSYKHLNGSELVLGGLQNQQAVEKVLSGDYDMIYVAEALEISKSEIQTLMGRLRGGAIPFQRLIADCNPGAHTHHLNQAALAGEMVRLKSRHEDNPRWHDGKKWTAAGNRYINEVLAKMTGLQRKRFFEGIWADAEGVVYDMFDSSTHILLPDSDMFPAHWCKAPLPSEWPRFWGIDFGFVNPFVWAQFALSPDNVLFLEYQIYRTKTLLGDHAKMIQEVTGYRTPKPEVWLTDHDAQDRAEMEALLKMMTTPAMKEITPGIDAVKERLLDRGDGRPGLVILRDSLVHPPDQELLEAGKPTCIQDEFGSYVWAKDINNEQQDKPEKANDHGMDLVRYVVAHVDKIGASGRGASPFVGMTIKNHGGYRR